jgi:hypothetical protein
MCVSAGGARRWCGWSPKGEISTIRNGPSGSPWPVYALRVSLLITVPMFRQHEYTDALGGDLECEFAKYLTVGLYF